MKQALVAVFDKQADAQQALDALIDEGFSHDNARFTSAESVGMTSSASERSDRDESLGDKVKELFGFNKDDDNRTYSEAVRRGHCVLTVDVDDNEAPRAEGIMERHNPVDIDERAAQWRESGGQGTPTGTQATDEERVIPVVEEELEVGKRESRRGGTRVRSHNYTVPAEESVQLHEQHTDVSRRPADRPATEEDKAVGEFDFETRDTAEEPVVGKEARVTEEVVVKQKSSDQTRTVKDDVRRTDVDVEKEDDEGRTTTDEEDKRRS